MNKYIMSACICLSSIGLAAFSPQFPQQPSFEMPSFATNPQDRLPVPNPEDLEIYLKELEQTDPAQLKELERMGNEIIASLSEQELAELSNMFGVDPQALRSEAESYLSQNQQEPETETRVEQQVEHKVPTKKEPIKPPKKEPKTDIHAAQATQKVIRDLRSTIEELRAKGAASIMIESHLRTWDDDLVLLLFYLNLLDKYEHVNRLPDKDQGKIVETLTKLQEKISPIIALIDPTIEQKIPNEYAFFNFTKAPTPEELKAAYEKKRAERDPKKIEAELTKQGKNKQIIKQEVKLARIAQIAIDEEYERLSDPKNIAEITRKNAQIRKEIEDTQSNWKILLSKITKELGNAFFEKRLLSKLEEYLKAYEPEEIKIKKAQEKAIKAQEKDQTKRAKKAPTMTKGSKTEPTISYGRIPRSYNSGGRSSGRSSYSGGYSSSQPSSNYRPRRPKRSSSSSSSGGGGGGSPSGRTTGRAGTLPPESRSDKLTDTIATQTQKLEQKNLKSSMQEFSTQYNTIIRLAKASQEGITESTSETDKTKKLKDYLTKDDGAKGLDLLTSSERLTREAERLAELGKKDKQVAKEFETFFEKTNLEQAALKTLLNNDTTKNLAITKRITANIKKTQEFISPFQKKK